MVSHDLYIGQTMAGSLGKNLQHNLNIDQQSIHNLHISCLLIVGSVNRITVTERIKAPFLV